MAKKVTALMADGSMISEYFTHPVFTTDPSAQVKLTPKQWAKIEAVYASSPSVAHLTPFALGTK